MAAREGLRLTLLALNMDKQGQEPRNMGNWKRQGNKFSSRASGSGSWAMAARWGHPEVASHFPETEGI